MTTRRNSRTDRILSDRALRTLTGRILDDFRRRVMRMDERYALLRRMQTE
jgi:hypothetical protein